jgi:uncharacterized protein YndB with AHSA1/START domain
MSDKPKFVYVTYIRTTAEKLWDALIKPEFTKHYRAGTWQESEWKKGASWRIMIPDGRVADAGEVVEIDPPRRLVLTWKNMFRPELTAEGYSRLTYVLEQQGDMVKLVLTHEMIELPAGPSKFIEAVSNGWPAILASLKSLLETGESLVATRTWPKDNSCLTAEQR